MQVSGVSPGCHQGPPFRDFPLAAPSHCAIRNLSMKHQQVGGTTNLRRGPPVPIPAPRPTGSPPSLSPALGCPQITSVHPLGIWNADLCRTGRKSNLCAIEFAQREFFSAGGIVGWTACWASRPAERRGAGRAKNLRPQAICICGAPRAYMTRGRGGGRPAQRDAQPGQALGGRGARAGGLVAALQQLGPCGRDAGV